MEAKVIIEGEIGVASTLKSVRSQIENFKEYDSINVLINSEGGLVDEGFAIHDYLVSLGKPIKTTVVGKCYSIATVIFLAGGERILSDNSRFMIHNPWGGVEGDAATMEQFAEYLRSEEERIVNFYALKTGLSKDVLKAMMDKETFMDKNEAVTNGFAKAALSEFKAVAKLSKQISKNDMTDKDTLKVAEILNKVTEKLSSFLAKAEMQDAKNILLTGSEELGVNIYIEAESIDEIVGKPAFLANEAGESSGEPAPDGMHMLEDGKALVVADGLVVELQEAEGSSDEEDEEMKALKAENEELKAQLDALTVVKAELEDSIKAKDSEISEVKASLEGVSKDLEEAKNMTVGKAFAQERTKEVKKSGHDLPDVDFGLKFN